MKNCYIHIPFCRNICSYCDFCKVFYQEELVDEYLIHLEKEIKSIYQNEVLETIYIGGGTPSCLNVKQLKKLLDMLSILKKDHTTEFTIECNFDSITEEKLSLLKRYGVNRLSFGLESIIPEKLKILGRNETKERVVEVISLCKRLGFENINVDLIYGVYPETIEDLEKEIDFILSLDVPHISTYSLMIEEHTKLFIDNQKSISEDLDYQMYEFICNKLSKKYIHYEVSNFAKENFSSKHNLCYWNNEKYYGFGLGASSYIGNQRVQNTRSLKKYLQDNYVLEVEKLNQYDVMSYEMILGLRKLDGVSKLEFRKKYKKEIDEVFPIKSLIDKKLLCDNGNIFIPIDKIYLSNEILVNFVKE